MTANMIDKISSDVSCIKISANLKFQTVCVITLSQLHSPLLREREHMNRQGNVKFTTLKSILFGI